MENLGWSTDFEDTHISLAEMRATVEAGGFVFRKMPEEKGGELWCYDPTVDNINESWFTHGTPEEVINDAFDFIISPIL